MKRDIQQAIKILRQGGIVVFPTDTAFGIGCRIDNPDAIRRLFLLRKRPINQAVPVLVDTLNLAQDFLLPIPKEVISKLVEPYWPGALTIILPCRVEKVPTLVRGGGKTIGVRIPSHTTTCAIIRELGIPILGPSANFSGEQTPYYFKDLDRKLISKVDFVMPGECIIKEASTVIDCSTKPWKILRNGVSRPRYIPYS